MNNIMKECSKHKIRHNVHLLIDKKRDRYYILIDAVNKLGWQGDTDTQSGPYLLASSYEGKYTELQEGLLLSTMFTDMEKVTEELDRVVPFYLSPKEVRVEGGYADLSRTYMAESDYRTEREKVDLIKSNKKRAKLREDADPVVSRLVNILNEDNTEERNS